MHAVRRFTVLLAFLSLSAQEALATSFLPIRPGTLRDRADVIVFGEVIAQEVVRNSAGLPETVTTLWPIVVPKGRLAGNLVLRQLGGILPGGSAMEVSGRPLFQVGMQTLVFATRRRDGGYSLTEFFLGRYDILVDEKGTLFAGSPQTSIRVPRDHKTGIPDAFDATEIWEEPHELESFLNYLASDPAPFPSAEVHPVGELQPLATHLPTPDFLYNDPIRRHFGAGPTVAYWIDPSKNADVQGSADGGRDRTLAAMATWNGDPNTTISLTTSTTATNFWIDLNSDNAPCFESSTCLGSTNEGIVGCAAWHVDPAPLEWRGSPARAIDLGQIWMRCTTGAFAYPGTYFQFVMLHELGHTLGLLHPNEGQSPQDGPCTNDQYYAIMAAIGDQHPMPILGNDDRQAIRWLYSNDALSCANVVPAARRFYTVTPCRIADTRLLNGGQPLQPPIYWLPTGQSFPRVAIIQVGGVCGIPLGATAVSANITAINASSGGSISIFPGNQMDFSSSSSVSFGVGRVRANNGIFALATDGSGTIAVQNNTGPAGRVDFVLDVNGYFAP